MQQATLLVPHAMERLDLYCHTLFSKKQIFLPIISTTYHQSKAPLTLPYSDIFVQNGDVVVVFHDTNGVFAPYSTDFMTATLKVNGFEMISNCILESEIVTFSFSNNYGKDFQYLLQKVQIGITTGLQISVNSSEMERVVESNAFKTLHSERKYQVQILQDSITIKLNEIPNSCIGNL